MFPDMPALDPPVFLELLGLARDLSLRVRLRPFGRRLPSLHVRRHSQILASQHSTKGAGQESNHFLEG